MLQRFTIYLTAQINEVTLFYLFNKYPENIVTNE